MSISVLLVISDVAAFELIRLLCLLVISFMILSVFICWVQRAKHPRTIGKVCVSHEGWRTIYYFLSAKLHKFPDTSKFIRWFFLWLTNYSLKSVFENKNHRYPGSHRWQSRAQAKIFVKFVLSVVEKKKETDLPDLSEIIYWVYFLPIYFPKLSGKRALSVSLDSLATPIYLPCKSYDPIVIGTDLERIRSEGETDLKRTCCYGIKRQQVNFYTYTNLMTVKWFHSQGVRQARSVKRSRAL